jgi:hypothetical protein
VRQWQVGDTTITRVADEGFELVVPQDEATTATLRAQAPWLSPLFVTDSYDLRVGSSALAIDTPGARVVVDPWLVFTDSDRTTAEAGAQIDRLLGRLDEAGLTPESVDVVIDTHIDNVGLNTRPTSRGEVPTFPNARYVIAPEEIAALRAGLLPGAEPYEVLLDEGLVDGTDGPVVGEVATEPAPGHSTGHRFVRIGPPGDQAVVVGHLFLHPAQVFSPEPRPGLDENIELAAKTRVTFLERATDEHTLVIGPLWANPGAGTIVRADEPGRWRLVPADG